MGKKLIKDSPIRKSVVGSFISEAPAEAPSPAKTEERQAVNTESRKEVSTDIQRSERSVKLTIIIPEEIDLLLEDIARKRRQETGKKPSKKALVIEALRLLAEKEGVG